MTRINSAIPVRCLTDERNYISHILYQYLPFIVPTSPTFCTNISHLLYQLFRNSLKIK